MQLTAIRKKIERIKEEIVGDAPQGELLEEAERLEASLYEFTKAAWPILVGDKPFIGGWHIEAVAEHLEATLFGSLDKLIILVPPRTLKTTLTAIMFHAWVWAQAPSMRFTYTSYGKNLAFTAAGEARKLIASDWYQARWGHRVKLCRIQATKGNFTNLQGGRRVSGSITGITGFGGDFTIMDDPNQTLEPQAQRDKVNEFVQTSWFSRADTLGLKVRIVAQQCTHPRDVQGLLAELDPSWVRLRLPLEFDADRPCKTIILPGTDKIWTDPRTTPGELLCPNHITPKDVEEFKRNLGRYLYACQYQQRPELPEGGLLRKTDWQHWTKPAPKFDFIIMSWDTAFTVTKESAYSAMSCWGTFEVNGKLRIMLISAWRGKVTYNELLERAERLSNNYLDIYTEPLKGVKKPDYIIIEGKASGHSLIGDLIERGIPAHAFVPEKFGDKFARIQRITPYLEDGLLYVARRAPDYALLYPDHAMLVDQAALFPNAESRDIVDSMAQALLYLIKIKKIFKDLFFLQDI